MNKKYTRVIHENKFVQKSDLETQYVSRNYYKIYNIHINMYTCFSIVLQ